MNAQMLTKLEALLERVQRNAAAPRALERRVAPATSEEETVEAKGAPELPLEEEGPVDEELAQEEVVDEGELLELDEPEAVGLEEVEAPASSRRVAASMDEALAGAADRLEPRTIPPESGPEPLAGTDALRQKGSRAPDVPTTEQLGQTVPLEEGPRAEFELDEPLSEPLQERAAEASFLEAELPSGASYGEHLAPPPEAREELERVRLGEVRAEVVTRPLISTNVVEFIEAQRGERPSGFSAILDETLALGG